MMGIAASSPMRVDVGATRVLVVVPERGQVNVREDSLIHVGVCAAGASVVGVIGAIGGGMLREVILNRNTPWPE